MDFGGDLAILEPSLVFQVCNMAHITGELKLVTAENVASLYFKEGELVFATIDTRKKKLGQYLIEKGWITAAQLESALEEYWGREGYERIGHILIARGYLDYTSLSTAIQEQMKEVVYEVLTWKRGQFIFFKDTLPGDEEVLLDVKLDHLILEGLKRLDESRKLQ